MESKRLDQVKVIREYNPWLGQEVIEFLIPLFDKDGDQVDVYATKASDGYVLRNEGWNINILLSDREMTPARTQVLNQFCKDHEMWIEGFEICTRSDGMNLVRDAYQFGLDLIELVEVIRK